LLKIKLIMKNIQKPRLRERILGYVVAEYSIFKLGLMCYEDIPKGKVLEFFVLVDRYDNYPKYRYIEVEGDLGYGTLLGQREYFEELSKHLPFAKYHISPWNTICGLISYIDGRTYLSEKEFEKRVALKDNRFSKGWYNLLNAYGKRPLENVFRKIKISFVAEIV